MAKVRTYLEEAEKLVMKDKANEVALLIQKFKDRIEELAKKKKELEVKLERIMDKDESELTDEDKDYYSII